MRKVVIVLGTLVLTSANPTSGSASHPTQLCLDIGSDQHLAVSNDDIVDSMTAFPGMTDAGHPPKHEGCVTAQEEPGQNWGGTVVRFEVTGAGDPDSSDSPGTSDATCTVPEDNNHCRADAFPSGGGEQLIRAWIDFGDGTQIDLTEGPNEESHPGDFGEPDGTDVSEWTWTHGDPPPDICGSDEVCWGRVTIDYQARDKQFLGRIKREDGSCGTGTVTLRKKRPGRDRRVAEALVSGPWWEVILDGRVRGRYYAVLSVTKTHSVYNDWPEYRCEGDRSRVIRV